MPRRMGRTGAAVGALAAALLLLAPRPAAAQQGALAGRVVDAATGRPVAEAELRLAGPDGVERRERSGLAGGWRFAGLRPGRHVLTVRAIGYAPLALDRALGAAGDTAVTVRLAPRPLALDQIVVTAARREQRLADAVVTTEVVGRREIEQTGASDLAAVLTEQAGIQLEGGHPAGTGVMLQGIGSERVLVLLDGQPLVGRLSGNFDLSRIPTAMVERVEVVKGPQSTLYGSEAMGGVVNVVTRQAPEASWGGSATVVGGTDGRRDATLGASLAAGAWNATVDAGLRTVERTPGRRETLGALAERADGAAKVRWGADSATSVEASALVLSERQRWLGGAFYDFADNTQLGARLTASHLFGGAHRLTPTLHLSRFEHLARRAQSGSPIAGTGDAQVQRLLEGELLYAGRVAGLQVDGGVEVRQEHIRTTDGRIDGADARGARTLHSAEPFAQVELGGGRWSVVPGARLTWNEQWGTHLTPRVAARWRPTDAVTLRASAGQGFRAPDFKELYLRFTNDAAGYAVYGNPSLRPESSTNLTGGAEWSGDRAYARAQLFWNRLTDFIETRPLPAAGSLQLYEYGNVEQGTTRGADLELGVAVGSLRAEAAYSYLDAEDRATGLPLLGRPEHAGRVALSHALPFGVRGSVAGVYTGATPMERGEGGAITSTRDAFARLDARLARRLPQGLELALGVDNLLDAAPDAWAGAVGRQLYTSLSWAFARPTR